MWAALSASVPIRVMPGLVPGIHAAVRLMPLKREFVCPCKALNRASLDGVDGRGEPGHDGKGRARLHR